MRVIWEEMDIIAGRRLAAEGVAEQWIIGYSVLVDGSHGNRNEYILISLDDGALQQRGNKAELAKIITDSELIPLELMQWIGRK